MNTKIHPQDPYELLGELSFDMSNVLRKLGASKYDAPIKEMLSELIALAQNQQEKESAHRNLVERLIQERDDVLDKLVEKDRVIAGLRETTLVEITDQLLARKYGAVAVIRQPAPAPGMADDLTLRELGDGGGSRAVLEQQVAREVSKLDPQQHDPLQVEVYAKIFEWEATPRTEWTFTEITEFGDDMEVKL